MKKKVKEPIINIGTGKDYSIKFYVSLINKIISPNKTIKIRYDKTKPNGTPRKVLSVNLAKKYGWIAKTNIENAIRITYKDYLQKKIDNLLALQHKNY